MGTSRQRPAKPFKGAVDGKPFTTNNQPTPEQKAKGWQDKRAERLLTQEILKYILGKDNQTGEDNLTGYVKDLIKLAKAGNPKAIETVNKCIEDDIQKVAQVNPDGSPANGPFKVEIVKPTEE